MKQFSFLLATVAVCVLQSCAPKKPIYKAPTTTVTKAVEPITKDPFVPFTRELFDKLSQNSIDVKQVQFYIDQQLVLSRNLSNNNIAVKNGKIILNNGKYVNEILFPQYTPVICDVIEGDGLRVKAEQGTNTLKFLNDKKYSPINYIFNPDKWNTNGGCEVNYDNNKYTVVCPTCTGGTPNEAKLVVRQSELANLDRQNRVVPGVKVGGGITGPGNNN